MLTHKRNRRMVLASVFGVLQRVVSIACTLVVFPVVLHALGAGKFGIWGAAASLSWMAGVLDIGTGYALVTLVARCLARDRTSEAGTHVAGALTIGSCLAAPVLFVVLIAWSCGFWPADGMVYLIAIVGLSLNVPLNSANMVWMGLQEGYFASAWELLQTLLNAAGLLTAVRYTTDVRVYVAVAYGSIVIANLGSLIHLYWRHRELRPERLPVPWAEMREVASTGIAFFVMMLAGGLTYMLDNVLALHLLGAEASAQMTIAMRICMTVIGMLVVVSQPLWPAFADAAHKNDRRWILHNLLRSSAMLTGVAVAGSLVLVFFGQQLLRLWLGTSLGIGRGLLWAIAGWIVAQTLVRVPFLLLNGLSKIRFQTVVIIIGTVCALGLKFGLAGKLGVSGILWATTASALLIVLPALLWRIWRWVKNPEDEGALNAGGGKFEPSAVKS